MSWNDERIDDLNKKVDRIDQRVDELGQEMHAEFRAVRTEMRTEFQAVRSEMKSDSQALRNELRTMTVTMVSGFVTLFAATLGLIAAMLTQF